MTVKRFTSSLKTLNKNNAPSLLLFVFVHFLRTPLPSSTMNVFFECSQTKLFREILRSLISDGATKLLLGSSRSEIIYYNNFFIFFGVNYAFITCILYNICYKPN